MLKRWNVTIPELSGEKRRHIYVWLPDDYDDQPEKHYPVLYLFDGHNIFLDEYAAFGKSWGMYDFMSYTRKDLIIVAVECNHEGHRRLCEYAPFSYRNAEHGHIEGCGNVMMRWMAHRLKAYMDNHYRTLPDREHTIIGGSSMGGLIALYGATAYNHIYGKAICLSPSLWVCPAGSLSMVARAKMAPDTVLYLSYGEKEMDNHKHNRATLNAVCKALLSKNINLTARIVKDGYHCEAAWEKEVPIFMECLEL